MTTNSPLDLTHILHPDNQAETVAVARALCPFAERATDATILICAAMVEAKGDLNVVSEYTGYALAQLRGHLQSKLANRIIQKLAAQKLEGEGYLTAVVTLIDIAKSTSQTGNARTNAAKLLIELHRAEEDKHSDKGDLTEDLNNMTLKQLESYCNSIKQDLVRIPHSPPAQDIDAIDV